MAMGKASDFKIYNEEFWGGVSEVMAQNVAAFNAASRGAIRLVPRAIRGDYEKESVLKKISGLVSRRDTTSVAAISDLKAEQIEQVGVKLSRKIGPVAQARDAWRKISEDPKEMSVLIGRQAAGDIIQDYLNTAILAVETAVQSNAAVVYTPGAVASFAHLLAGLQKLGDAHARVVAWVMYSKPFFDLQGQMLTDKVYGSHNVQIFEGPGQTFLGRPVIVTDSPALWDANGSLTDTYNILGLTDGAVEVAESEERDIVMDLVTGTENIGDRLQGEHAFNVKVKGYAYQTGAGANPTDTVLGTTSSWAKYVTSDKDTAGVRIVVQ